MTVKLASVRIGGGRENGRITWTIFVRPPREVYDEAYKKQTEIAPQHTEDIFTQGRQTTFVV